MNLTTATPAEIDSAYCKSAQILSVAEAVLAALRSRRHPDEESIARAEIKVTEERANVEPFITEFDRRGGWTRAFIAMTSDGHVHSSMECSTLHHGLRRTALALLPEFSGHDEAEIISTAGWRACTVCYPSAPVGDPKSLPSKLAVDVHANAERTARAEAKAARDAKRAANAPTVTGEPLLAVIDGYEQQFKTERAASMAYVQELVSFARYVEYNGMPLVSGGLHTIEAALAGKHGVSVEEMRAKLVAKARAKATRENVDFTAAETQIMEALERA